MTAVQFLVEKLEAAGMLDPYYKETLRIPNLIKQAMEMEKKQMEISDEEIENLLINWRKETGKTRYTSVEGFRAGARLYREQLKNK